MNKQILTKMEHYDGAADLAIKIAIGSNAKSKSWMTVPLSWAQLVSAFKIPKRTKETFEEYKSSDKATQGKMKDVGGFLGGALSGDRRLKKEVTGRDLVTLDFDGPDGKGMSMSLGELLEVYKEKYNNEAFLYTTHSHHKDAPRVRLIIPLARTLSPAEYEPVARMIASELSINEVDPASFVISQFMYWPSAAKDGHYQAVHVPGAIMDPDEVLDCYEDPTDKSEWPSAKREGKAAQPFDWDGTISDSSTKTQSSIPDRDAIRAVKDWVKHEWDNLQDYQNFIAALMVIAKAAQVKEISPEAGRQCAALLAGDRAEWQQYNIEKYEKELANSNIITDYSFRKKFMHDVSTAAEDFEFAEDDLVCYRDIEPKAVQWLWDGYIPLGMLTTIQGDPGGGKTYVSTGITAGITNGVLPPDDFGIPGNITPRNVLFINGEDSPEHTIRPRLDQAGANPEKVFTLKIDKDPLDFSQIRRIEAAIKKIKPLLVVFDPIQQFLGAGVDMHRANEIRPVLARLKDLAAEYSFACVFVMHMNKQSGGKAQYRGLGSIDISAIMRSQLLVGENRNVPGGRLVVPIKNSLGKLQPAQGFTITDLGLGWTGPDLKATEEDVLLQASAKGGTELDNAISWVRERLEEAPLWSGELESAAELEGISKGTLIRARLQLKDKWEIDCKKAPGIKKWYWIKTHRTVIFKENQELAYQPESEPFE